MKRLLLCCLLSLVGCTSAQFKAIRPLVRAGLHDIASGAAEGFTRGAIEGFRK